jgi:hypothetical protein
VLTVLLCLFVALLIGEVVNDAVGQSPKVGARATATWVAGVEPMLVSSAAIAPALSSVERNPGGLTRQSLNAALEALNEVLQGNEASVSSLAIKAPSTHALALVSQLLGQRQRVVASIEQMVSAATAVPHDHASAVAECIDAQSAIRRGDSTLESLRRSLGTKYATVFRSSPTWASVLPHLAAPGCGTLASSLSSNVALTQHRLLKLVAISVLPNPVQINGVPNPTTTTTSTTTTLPHGQQTTTTSTTVPVQTGTTTTSTSSTTTQPPVTTTTLQIPPSSARSVLPPTGTISVQVVVQDSGNESAGPVLVSVQLVPKPTETSVTRSRAIATLTPGGAKYMDFKAIPLGNIAGSFEIKVTATAIGTPTVQRMITMVRSPR